jgi:hypothetical protein
MHDDRETESSAVPVSNAALENECPHYPLAPEEQTMRAQAAEEEPQKMFAQDVTGLEQEMSAMRVTWASAHTALTQDLRELMVRFQEATPLQIGAQLMELRAGLESEIAHRREAEDMLTAKLRQFDELMPPKSPEMISSHEPNYTTVEVEEKQVAVVGLMSTPVSHDDFGSNNPFYSNDPKFSQNDVQMAFPVDSTGRKDLLIPSNQHGAHGLDSGLSRLTSVESDATMENPDKSHSPMQSYIAPDYPMQDKWKAKWLQKLQEFKAKLLEEEAMETRQSLQSTELTKAKPTMDEESASKTRSIADTSVQTPPRLSQRARPPSPTLWGMLSQRSPCISPNASPAQTFRHTIGTQWQQKWKAKSKEKFLEGAREIEAGHLEVTQAMETQQSLQSTELTEVRPTMDEESASKTRSRADTSIEIPSRVSPTARPPSPTSGGLLSQHCPRISPTASPAQTFRHTIGSHSVVFARGSASTISNTSNCDLIARRTVGTRASRIQGLSTVGGSLSQSSEVHTASARALGVHHLQTSIGLQSISPRTTSQPQRNTPIRSRTHLAGSRVASSNVLEAGLPPRTYSAVSFR